MMNKKEVTEILDRLEVTLEIKDKPDMLTVDRPVTEILTKAMERLRRTVDSLYK